MQKKGQLTLFLVLGIFLIILLFIFLQNNSKDFSDNSETGLNSLNQYLQLCFNDRFEDVLKYNALQGGFFNINTSSSSNEFLIENKIRNYLTNKNQLIPNKKQLEFEIENGFKSIVPTCIENNPLKKFDLDANYKKLNLDVFMTTDELKYDLFLPIKINHSNSQTIMEQFSGKLNTLYYDMYLLSINITEQQTKSEDICISCFYNNQRSKEIDIDVELIDSGLNNLIIYTLTSKDLKFTFAHIITINSQLEFNINQPNKLFAHIGRKFQYKIETDAQSPMFYDDTDLFEINNKTGLITFVPTIEELGEHIIKVDVKDNSSMIKNVFLTMNVSGEINEE